MVRLSFCILVFVAYFSVNAAGDWPMWRHDTTLTAFQPLPGAMKTEPRVLVKYFVGSQQGAATFADLRGTGKKDDILITARARLFAYDAGGRKLWESAPEGYVIDRVEWVDDLDGDGRNEVVARAGHIGITRQSYLILDGTTGQKLAVIEIKTGDFSWRGSLGPYLPGKKGKQIFLVTSMCQNETGGPRSFGEFSLWAFDGKTATRQWGWSPTEHVVFYPAVMLGDLNGDGRYHAVIDSWCHVWNIELATGTAVSHAAWNPQGANERQYGWNELVDVDGDGKLDFVNISRTKHVDVLRNVGGKLQFAWAHGWPDPVTTEARSLQIPTEPVADLEGDGHKEIVSSLFDGVTDKRWHLSIADAVTGAELAQMTDTVAIATVPLWGTNGARAIFCVHSTNLEFNPPQTCEVWRLRNKRMEKLWASSKPFLTQSTEPGEPSERRFYAYNAVGLQWPVTNDVDGDGRAEFFTSDLQAWGVNDKGDLVPKSGKPRQETPRALPKDIPPLQGTTLPYLLAADLKGEGRNQILLYDNTSATVLRLETNILTKVDEFPSSEIPIVCDLLGDGKPCVITGGRSADGNLWVQGTDTTKKSLWHYVFPHSGACGQYSERPHFFNVGHFTRGKQLDVCTYATKPEARTYVLDGRKGKPVWEREQLPAIERHYHPLGGRISVWDYNHDGADDILFCNPDYYCVADGHNGNLLVGPISLQPLLKWWAAYASPAALARPGGEPVVYLGGVYSSRGSISLDGTRGLWCEYLPTERWPMREGNSGFNEGLLPPSKERGWRGGQMEADGTLVCYDIASGKHSWQMQIPTAANGIVSGDVTGSGEPVFLFGGADGNLLVVRDAGDHGEVVWRKHFDGPVGTPILADVVGDGKSQIVVSVGDGYVYVLGN